MHDWDSTRLRVSQVSVAGNSCREFGYAQALTPDKRKAQSKVIRMILPKANQLEQRIEVAS